MVARAPGFRRSPGRGSAWLERLHGVQEVPSSNLGAPTIVLKDLRQRGLA